MKKVESDPAQQVAVLSDGEQLSQDSLKVSVVSVPGTCCVAALSQGSPLSLFSCLLLADSVVNGFE